MNSTMIAKMELCTPPKFPQLLLPNRTIIRFQPLIRCTTHSPLLHNHNFGLLHRSREGSCSSLALRSTTSEDISTVYVKDEPQTVDETQLVQNKQDYESQLDQELQEGSLFDNPLKLFKFLEDLNIKLDYEEIYSFLAFGSGGAVVVWVVAAIVDAIDSIPVLPKALELVGLGYSLWFSSRYLILKKNREEFFASVEQLKQQVLGSEDD